MSIATMNRILKQCPTGSATYLHRTPPWIIILMRAGFVVIALLVAVFSARSWGLMPLPAQALVVVLVPVFLAVACWSKPWSRTCKFLADRTGIYFPDNSLLVLTLNKPDCNEWLHVPWAKIENLRISTTAGVDGGPCIAFDVKASQPERERFFKHVEAPRDNQRHHPDIVFVAYDDSPPSPRKTLAILKALSSPLAA